MYFTKKKALISCINVLLVLIVFQIISDIWKKYELQLWKETPIILYWPRVDNNIDCFESQLNDALLSVDDAAFQTPEPKSIFFHETSCRGGIDSRQACAVESAARANPDWVVYLLFNSPVTEDILKKTCLVTLFQYRNVRLARIYAKSFSKNTILNPLITKKLWKSKHPVEHSADIMRMLTLNKWGGVYLDLDMLVIKSFNSLPENWIAKESSFDLASGVMRFSKDEVGQNITMEVLKEINSSFHPLGWNDIGSKAIERVLRRRCADAVDFDDCQGLSVFAKELFYPISFAYAQMLIKDERLPEIKEPYTIHTWNLLTGLYKIHPKSGYAQIASKVCPYVYNAYVDQFGV